MAFEEKKRAEIRLRRALREAGQLRAALAEGDRTTLRAPLRELEEALQLARETLWRIERSGAMSWEELRESAEHAFQRIERHLQALADPPLALRRDTRDYPN